MTDTFYIEMSKIYFENARSNYRWRFFNYAGAVIYLIIGTVISITEEGWFKLFGILWGVLAWWFVEMAQESRRRAERWMADYRDCQRKLARLRADQN